MRNRWTHEAMEPPLYPPEEKEVEEMDVSSEVKEYADKARGCISDAVAYLQEVNTGIKHENREGSIRLLDIEAKLYDLERKLNNLDHGYETVFTDLIGEWDPEEVAE